MTPYEIAEIIAKEPLIASLLYDIDLLPEQIKEGDSRRYSYMLAVIGHMQAALAKADQAEEARGAALRDRDGFAESCRMQDERIARLVSATAPRVSAIPLLKMVRGQRDDVADALRDLLNQVNLFCEREGEADFFTGTAIKALAKCQTYEQQLRNVAAEIGMDYNELVRSLASTTKREGP